MNNVDILALIASKTIDLTNLRTTHTANINFVSSYGQTTMYIDDYANVNMIGILTNSGGVQFTNGMQVIGGTSISCDANNFLQLSPLGTTITGPLTASNGLTVGAISPEATGNLTLNGYG